jgi:hypothetical protein
MPRFCAEARPCNASHVNVSAANYDSRFADDGGAIMIKKVAGGYKVLSEKGKNLGGPYKTKKEAETRLRQVEYFKHSKG